MRRGGEWGFSNAELNTTALDYQCFILTQNLTERITPEQEDPQQACTNAINEISFNSLLIFVWNWIVLSLSLSYAV